MISDQELKEILLEFVPESREHIQLFESALLTLEREPGDTQAIQDAFRAVHSLKGNSSFLGLEPLEAVAHGAEAVLSKVRAGSLRADEAVVDSLLGLVDSLHAMVSKVELQGHLRDVEVADLLAGLAVWLGAKPTETTPMSHEQGGARPYASDNKIRVDVALLDRMMNLVGELVLARNQMLQRLGDAGSEVLAPVAQRLNLVTTQLQEVAMKTRMQPMSSMWTRFPRVVRDLSRDLGKRTRLVMVGRETELDKRIIEELADPLTHLVRNAIDHGIEAPDRRRAQGKDPEATLSLRAFHEGGMVNIEVADDGAGIDVAQLRAHAFEAELMSEEELELLDDRQLLELLFVPGFSTRGVVTKVSGRGVGLDVVKANIESLGGSVDIQSQLGRGTTFKIKIPLTLAIIPALIVGCRDERFAIPQANLIEVVRVSAGQEAGARVESVQGVHVMRLRGRLLPVAPLAAELGLGDFQGVEGQAKVVVLQADGRHFGLLVDEVLETEEIVVKPLWRRLKHIPHYAGAAVLGDGRVALILDTPGLAESARLLGVNVKHRERARPVAAKASDKVAAVGELVLVCRNGHDGRLALRASEVSRLEEISVSRLETAGAVEVVQYGEEILPLVRIAQLLPERRRVPRGPVADEAAADETLQVVIYSRGDQSVGLVVDELLDIVETPIQLQKRANRAGVLGSMVVLDRVTEFLDMDAAMAYGRAQLANSGSHFDAEARQ